MSLRRPFRSTPVKLGAEYRAREAANLRDGRFFATLMILGPITVFGVIWTLTPVYVAGADAPLPAHLNPSAETSSPSIHYSGCNDVRAAGAAPLYRGDPGYRPDMDGDDDGIACEPHRGGTKIF